MVACDKDKTGPIIMLTDKSFCTLAGNTISLGLEITDEDLKEVNMTVPDLDFITTITAEQFKTADGFIEFLFTLDTMTPSGSYIMGIEALDLEENASTAEVTIKVN